MVLACFFAVLGLFLCGIVSRTDVSDPPVVHSFGRGDGVTRGRAAAVHGYITGPARQMDISAKMRSSHVPALGVDGG